MHTSDARDLEAGPDLSWKPALSSTQNDIKEFLRRWDGSNRCPCLTKYAISIQTLSANFLGKLGHAHRLHGGLVSDLIR